MGKFCEGKPGDVVYSVPKGGESPTKAFLILGDKKVVKAIRATGEERDYNPEDFALSLEEANRKAVEKEYESLFQSIRDSFDRVSKYRGEKQ